MSTKSNNNSAINEFLNKVCEGTDMDKDSMRASTNRNTAKKIAAEIGKYNGLTPDNFSEQFKSMMNDIKEFSSNGATRIQYKYTSRPTLITGHNELSHDALEERDFASPKYSAYDSQILVNSGESGGFKPITGKNVRHFKKMLGSTYMASIMKELGYRISVQTIESGRKNRTIFDVTTIDWSESRR